MSYVANTPANARLREADAVVDRVAALVAAIEDLTNARVAGGAGGDMDVALQRMVQAALETDREISARLAARAAQQAQQAMQE